MVSFTFVIQKTTVAAFKSLLPMASMYIPLAHQLMSVPVTVRISGKLLYVSNWETRTVCYLLLCLGDYVGSFGQGHLSISRRVSN